MLGGDYQRLYEEPTAAGGVLRGGPLERLNVGQTQRALDAALPVAAVEVMQLSLFTSAEQQQVEDNLRFLERRLAELPGEMERETRASRERFANPTPHLFPVTITHLVPERLG